MIFKELSKKKIGYAVVRCVVPAFDYVDWFIIVPEGCSNEIVGLRFSRDSSNRKIREKDLQPDEIKEAQERIKNGHLEEVADSRYGKVYQQKGFNFKQFLNDKNK